MVTNYTTKGLPLEPSVGGPQGHHFLGSGGGRGVGVLLVVGRGGPLGPGTAFAGPFQLNAQFGQLLQYTENFALGWGKESISTTLSLVTKKKKNDVKKKYIYIYIFHM